jgi:predicted P-loop ATPase
MKASSTQTTRASTTPRAKKTRGNGSQTDDDWVRDTRGRIVAGNLENIRLALRRLGITPIFDAFSRELRINGASVLDDIIFDRIWVDIADEFGWHPNTNNLRRVIVIDAHKLAIHPVKQYLDRLRWDGTPRLDQWLITYAKAENSVYVRAVSALPLLAAVRRVRSPGAKFDELLILESPEGRDKSTALRTLCPIDEWFSDGVPLAADTKEVIERTSGKWIIEVPELHTSRGSKTEAQKAFLSRQIDGPVRLAYARLPTTVPRQFVLIGTTNQLGHYLKDFTGARRYWPVAVRQFDVAALARDRDQLWAEAAAREPGTSIRLPQKLIDATGAEHDLWAQAAEEQEARRAVDPWEEIIEAQLDIDGMTPVVRIASMEIWKALDVEAKMQDNRAADRVAAIMGRLGFKKLKNSRQYWDKVNVSTADVAET